MRTKILRLSGEKKEGVLVAGGAGFKIYTIAGSNGWALDTGKMISFVEEETPEAQTVANYVNLKYQPLSAQKEIQQQFSALINDLSFRAPELNP